MESESYPVILRCKDVSVAIPVKTLIRESSIFKSMYESVQSNSDLSDSASGRSSGNSSMEDIQSLAENEPSDSMDYSPQSKNPGNAEASKAATTDSDSDNDTNSNKEKHQNTKETSNNPQSKYVKTNHQFDTIDLSNFNTRSVEILFISLKGFPEIIDACNSLSDLYGALKLCDEYGISSPIPQISSIFKTCDTISMTNLIDVMEIAEDIEKMLNYDDISNGLFQRCVSYARWNFASFQIIMKLIMENKTKAILVVKILKELKDETEAILRFKVENFSKLAESDETKKSSTFIVKNLCWKIEVGPQAKDKKKIGITIHCNNPSATVSWRCKTNIKLRIVNCQTQDVTFQSEINHLFKNNEEEAIVKDFKTFPYILDFKNGFIKDDMVMIEAKISVIKVVGLPSSLGISSEEMGWFEINKSNNLFQIDNVNKDLPSDDLEDFPVIICGENKKSIAVVDKSVLVKESSVFQTMFSQPWTRSQNPTDDNESNQNMRQINLTSYNPLSVKYLMDYLQGYPKLLKVCKNLTLIGDCLKLCDYYDIRRPLPELMLKISNLKITMLNVMEAHEVAFDLVKIESFKTLFSNLRSKIIHFLRFNLGSWQVLIKFIVNNSHKLDAIVKFIEQLAEKNQFSIRFKTTEIKENIEGKMMPYLFIHHNFLWRIVLDFQEEKEDYLKFKLYLVCPSPEYNTTSTCKAGVAGFLCTNASGKYVNIFNNEVVYKAKDVCWSWNCISKTDLLNKENDYLKDGCASFGFYLYVSEPTGLPVSMGITEDMILIR